MDNSPIQTVSLRKDSILFLFFLICALCFAFCRIQTAAQASQLTVFSVLIRHNSGST
jgi:hypothetical protein